MGKEEMEEKGKRVKSGREKLGKRKSKMKRKLNVTDSLQPNDCLPLATVKRGHLKLFKAEHSVQGCLRSVVHKWCDFIPREQVSIQLKMPIVIRNSNLGYDILNFLL